MFVSKRPQRLRNSGGPDSALRRTQFYKPEPSTALNISHLIEMAGRVEDLTHDGRPSTHAAESPARQNSLSLGRSALRIAVVLAIGFNISGFGAVYETVKTLVNYVHGIESPSASKTPLGVATYTCSGILLAIGTYLLIQRMTSTAHGGKSPILKSQIIAMCFHRTLRSLGGARWCPKSDEKRDELHSWRRRHLPRSLLRGLRRICHCFTDGIGLV